MKNMSPEEAMKNAENWHKKNHSDGNIEIVKKLLEEETEVSPTFILHNEGKIYLQFCGWSINLLDDGTWHWEDTTGG